MKTNYKYFLATGKCIEYSLPPDLHYTDTICKIVGSYFSQRNWNDTIYVSPAIFKAILVEHGEKGGVLFDEETGTKPIGWRCISMETPVGSMSIIPRLMEWPIFIGSEDELKDNSFNLSMEKILCE